MIALIISYSDSMPTQQLQPQELQVPLLDWPHTMSMVQYRELLHGIQAP